MRFFSFIIVVLLFVQCQKPEKISEIPAIKFIDVPIIDTVDLLGNPIRRAKLMFSLIDGDGDIGLKDNDTLEIVKFVGGG